MGQSKANTDQPATWTPASLAEALQPFLVEGEGRNASAGSLTIVDSPLEAAVMFADLAARMAQLGPLPDACGMTITINFGPWGIRRRNSGHASEAEQCQVVVAVAELHGVEPSRQVMSAGSVHYTARGATAAGLTVTAATMVEPTTAEREEFARREAERAEKGSTL